MQKSLMRSELILETDTPLYPKRVRSICALGICTVIVQIIYSQPGKYIPEATVTPFCQYSQISVSHFHCSQN